MRHAPFLKFVFMLSAICGSFWLTSAEAVVRVHIDLSAQRMNVESDSGSYSWPISTARRGYVTPNGSFRPQSLQRMHYSKKYHNSPMPYSIFFRGGFAIHGTYETRYLGYPVSHGCVRLSPEHAAILYHMVQAEGARITITGSPPRTHFYARAPERHRYATRHAERPQQAFGFFPFLFSSSQSDDSNSQ
jgi:hypothetical protein